MAALIYVPIFGRLFLIRGGLVHREPVAKPAFGLVFCLKLAAIHSKGDEVPRNRNYLLPYPGGKAGV